MKKHIQLIVLFALAIPLAAQWTLVLADCTLTGSNYTCNISCPAPGQDYWAIQEASGSAVQCCEGAGCNPNGGTKAGAAKSFYNAMLSTAGVTPGAGASAVGAVSLKAPINGTIEDIISNVINFIFWLGIVICPILIIWGGFDIATAGDNQNKVSQGKQTITYAIVGLVIIGISLGLANAIKGILAS